MIIVENISKIYIKSNRFTRGTLAESLKKMARYPFDNFARIRNLANPKHVLADQSEFYALRDVSFTVDEGRVVGVIGGNGAGKSTLLKILARITPPSRGRFQLRGRVGALLEVGTGFNPELTGRENVFLNGTLIGMTKNEVKMRFDEIVEYSGVGEFIDTPVKRYSSGMRVRLAFAVSAHLSVDVMLVDEVLSVGDAQFQKKSLSKLRDVSSSGRTVLFVSHNMSAVMNICDSCIWMDQGIIKKYGDTQSVIKQYIEGDVHEDQNIYKSKYDEQRSIFISEVETWSDDGKGRMIRITWVNKSGLKGLILGIAIINTEGTHIANISPPPEEMAALNDNRSTGILACFDDGILHPGHYGIVVSLYSPGEGHDLLDPAVRFEKITDDKKRLYYSGSTGLVYADVIFKAEK